MGGELRSLRRVLGDREIQIRAGGPRDKKSCRRPQKQRREKRWAALNSAPLPAAHRQVLLKQGLFSLVRHWLLVDGMLKASLPASLGPMKASHFPTRLEAALRQPGLPWAGRLSTWRGSLLSCPEGGSAYLNLLSHPPQPPAGILSPAFPWKSAGA